MGARPLSGVARSRRARALSGGSAVAPDNPPMTDWTLRLVTGAGLLALVGRVPEGATVGGVVTLGLAVSALAAVCIAAAVFIRRRLAPVRVRA